MAFKHKTRRRLGAATVEFAVVAPIFLLIIFGGIEFASIHITQCAMENAAFEGARQGIIPGATAEKCKTAAEQLMGEALVSDFSVYVTPAIFTPDTDAVEVVVEVPLSPENKFGLSAFLSGQTLTRSIELPRGESR